MPTVTPTLQDIHDLLGLSMPAGEIGAWLVSPQRSLDGARPIECLTRSEFGRVYAAALAL